MTARTHRMASTANSAPIITFVTRSMPFCKPARVTSTPMPTVRTMYAADSTGFASSASYTAETPDASSPSNVPRALRTMNASIHPVTTV